MTGHRKHLRGRKSVPGSPSRRALNLAGGLLLLTTLLSGCGGGSLNQSTPPSVSNPTPVITSLTPAAIIAGSAAVNVTINGTGFIATSVVDVNGAAVQSTFYNATQLVGALPASALANASVAAITVTNPAPGGGVAPPDHNRGEQLCPQRDGKRKQPGLAGCEPNHGLDRSRPPRPRSPLPPR